MERKKVTFTPLEESAEEEWTIPEFLALVNKAVESIPEEFRSVAKVRLEGEWEETSRLLIRYSRVETDEEAANRIAKKAAENEAYARSEAQREYNVYMALKAKYG